jgi:hypothetical protein
MRPTLLTCIGALLAALLVVGCAENPITGNPNFSAAVRIAGNHDGQTRRRQCAQAVQLPYAAGQLLKVVEQGVNSDWTERGFTAKPPFTIHRSLITHLA